MPEAAAAGEGDAAEDTAAAVAAEGMARGGAPTAERPFMAQVLENSRMSAAGHFQDVRRVVLDTAGSGITHAPGDVAYVLPENTDADVEAVCSIMEWDPEAWVVAEPASGVPLPRFFHGPAGPAGPAAPRRVGRVLKAYLDVGILAYSKQRWGASTWPKKELADQTGLRGPKRGRTLRGRG